MSEMFSQKELKAAEKIVNSFEEFSFQMIAIYAQCRLTRAEKRLAEAQSIIEKVQWSFNLRRCPMCAGWNMSENGETDFEHTDKCPIRTWLSEADHPLRDGEEG